MLPLATLLPLILACNPDDKETGDTGPLPGEQVGDVFDLETTSTGITAHLPAAGTYLVILMSTAEDESTTYGYGAAASAAARYVPPSARPVPPTGRPATSPGGPALRPDEYTRSFMVWDGSHQVTVDAVADSVTDNLVIWRDITTENPLGDIDPTTLTDVADMFDHIVLPRTRAVFGQESDVEGSGRIDVLLSYTVNSYGAVAYVSTCDIAALFGCGGYGNDSEIIYMGYPDPASSYSSANAIVEVWAHEFNHLVYSYHKLVLNDQEDAQENIYVTEGMSELAQDLTGFNNGNQYIWASAIDMRDYYGGEDYSIQGVSLNDFLRGSGYYDLERDGPLRGGAYLFLRYLFEQAGGMTVADDGTQTDSGGMAWVQSWFDAAELGPDTVVATTGRDPVDVAFDWYTALVVTGRGVNDDPVYNYQDRVQDPLTGFEYGVDPYATIHGWLTLNGPPVQDLAEADGEIRAGGVEYLLVEVAEAEDLEIPVDPAALPRARALRL